MKIDLNKTFLSYFLKKFRNGLIFIAKYFFASAVLAIILGIAAAGLVFWKLRLNAQELLKANPNQSALDEKNYRQAIKALESLELLIQKVEPEAYHNIF